MTCERVLRYLKVGAFLHLITVVGLLTLVISARISFEFFQEELFVKSFFWGALALWALTIPFFSQFDAYGRYQNYKQIKDAIFEMSFDTRLIRPFMYSKCQRDAVIIAGEDLGCGREIRTYFRAQGYRWYHVLPDAFVRNPLVLFYGVFWKRILFTRHYELKNFFW
ncbi:MAG: hypothetical protein WBV45_12455 [Lutimonas sp.]